MSLTLLPTFAYVFGARRLEMPEASTAKEDKRAVFVVIAKLSELNSATIYSMPKVNRDI